MSRVVEHRPQPTSPPETTLDRREEPASDRAAATGSRTAPTSLAKWLRSIPIEAILVGLGLFALLTLFVAADPPRNATFSLSPFTDEGFNLVNSRNLVQLGRWGTDEWTRYLVELPFSLL